MAKKHGIGAILFFSAVSAVAGGVLAYRHREEIDNIVKDMAETLDATEEEGFFTVDLGSHGKDSAPKAENSAEDRPASDDGEPDSDFVDLHENESQETAEASSAEEDDKIE